MGMHALRLLQALRGFHDRLLYWLQETGTSFNITPKKGGSFTPSKMLLMQRERRMNMLTPDQGSKMFNADIETGKILN